MHKYTSIIDISLALNKRILLSIDFNHKQLRFDLIFLSIIITFSSSDYLVMICNYYKELEPGTHSSKRYTYLIDLMPKK